MLSGWRSLTAGGGNGRAGGDDDDVGGEWGSLGAWEGNGAEKSERVAG
jgi:hypothetical protein